MLNARPLCGENKFGIRNSELLLINYYAATPRSLHYTRFARFGRDDGVSGMALLVL